MNEYELSLPPERRGRNAITGRFMKGLTPWNKGKKWADYLSKRKQRRCAKGWKNPDNYRCRGANAGRNKRPVIAVFDDGTWYHFSYLGEAAQVSGFDRNNIGRCCRENARELSPKVRKRNTDHKYLGIRWYFEDDKTWTTKIKKI